MLLLKDHLQPFSRSSERPIQAWPVEEDVQHETMIVTWKWWKDTKDAVGCATCVIWCCVQNSSDLLSVFNGYQVSVDISTEYLRFGPVQRNADKVVVSGMGTTDHQSYTKYVVLKFSLWKETVSYEKKIKKVKVNWNTNILT